MCLACSCRVVRVGLFGLDCLDWIVGLDCWIGLYYIEMK